ncbi:MAG: type VI secretion system ImpA family N-terminal domain-containing protein [Planctomycetes bacterium]|nr:type VI secretion system ImpA family N-terminal domain-containing protein [Planctomycetota bacterium]
MAEVTAALGSAAIPGATPAGASVRYDPEFESIETEIQKLESPTGGVVNWKKVADAAAAIIANKSKDLLVAAYLAGALYNIKGYAGLAIGVGVMNEMIKAHWEGLMPEAKRMRARTAAVQWLVDRIGPEIERKPPPSPPERDGLALCARALEELNSFAEKYAGDAPDLGVLSRAVRSKLEVETAPAAAGAAANAPQGGEAMSGPTSGGAPAGSRAEAMKRLQEVADFLRRTEPHSPVSYLVQRAVKWGAMPLEDVIKELVKDTGARESIFETLGLPKPPSS